MTVDWFLTKTRGALIPETSQLSHLMWAPLRACNEALVYFDWLCYAKRRKLAGMGFPSNYSEPYIPSILAQEVAHLLGQAFACSKDNGRWNNHDGFVVRNTRIHGQSSKCILRRCVPETGSKSSAATHAAIDRLAFICVGLKIPGTALPGNQSGHCPPPLLEKRGCQTLTWRKPKVLRFPSSRQTLTILDSSSILSYCCIWWLPGKLTFRED